MSGHVDHWLPEYVLDSLPADERERVELHLGRCPRCLDEEAALAEVFGTLGLALPQRAPPPGLRQRLMRLVEAEAGAAPASPLAAFADRLARLFDVTVERARGLLLQAADPSAWVPGPVEGITLLHVLGGPRCAGADAGLVRMAPGVCFPHHRHVGDEHALILTGGMRDVDGREYRAGDEQSLPAGSAHDFVSLPDEECVFAAVVHDGLVFSAGYKI